MRVGESVGLYVDSDEEHLPDGRIIYTRLNAVSENS